MSLVNLKKRLEIIKMLIQLGDVEKVRPHLFQCNFEVNKFPLNSFLYLLEQKNFKRLTLEIDKIIIQIDSKKIDPLENLKKLNQKLLDDIKTLESEKISIKSIISEFELRYHKELGQDVLKVAYYEQMKLNESTLNTYTKKEVQNKKPTKKSSPNLSRDEFETLLKQQFRKATKLCHPDSPEKANVENLEEQFIQLKIHLKNKNLHGINELIEKLRPYQNQELIDDITRQKYNLEKQISESQKIKMLHLDEIEFLKESQSYKTITSHDNIDIYFAEQRKILNEKIQIYKQKFAQ